MDRSDTGETRMLSGTVGIDRRPLFAQLEPSPANDPEREANASGRGAFPRARAFGRDHCLTHIAWNLTK